MTDSRPHHKITILVRLDANHTIGYAHAVRTMALLENLDISYNLHVVGNGEKLGELFPMADAVTFLDVGDEEPFERIVALLHPDLILIDHPRPSQELWQAARQSPFNLVCAIDDEGGDVPADMIINGTILKQYHVYRNLPEGAEVLCGGKYALLRKPFAQANWSRPPSPSITIIIGSGRRAEKWAHYLLSDVISRQSCDATTMIVGNFFPSAQTLRKKCLKQGVEFVQGCNADEMAQRMANSSLVLITGGMIIYEALAVGVPAVVFPQEPNLPPESEWFERHGCIINLGYDGGMVAHQVEEAIDRILNNDDISSEISNAQKRTIDGNGMSRAANAIIKRISTFDTHTNRISS